MSRRDDKASALIAKHGLNPRGFEVHPRGPVTVCSPVFSDGYEASYIPWSAPAQLVLWDEFERADDSYTLLEGLIDDAERRGMGVRELLGHLGRGPEFSTDDEDGSAV